MVGFIRFWILDFGLGKDFRFPIQNSSGNGSSKSSLVQIAPACNPAVRCLVGDVMGAKRTRGMPPSVSTTSMPLSARDNNSFKFVCASCTSTVFVSIAVILGRSYIV